MLKKLLGRKPKAASPPGQPGLNPVVSENILNIVGSKSIPPMPGAAQKAFQLVTDPNADARDFIEVIESDEALSARIIKIANSVYFDRGKKSNTIDEAVAKIGINELRCLLNATSLSEIFPSKHPLRSTFWANDIATALIARNLCQSLDPGNAESAFLGGLMHDVGKLLLLQRCGEEYARAVKQVEETARSFTEAESQIFPFDHTEVGQLIAERWNFSDGLRKIIRQHHEPWVSLQGPEHSLVRIIKAADLISHALGLGHPRGFGRFQNAALETLAEMWQALGLNPETEKNSLPRYSQLFAAEYDLYSGRSS